MKAGDIVEGRYRIIHLISEGGMSTVYLAEHVLIKRRVAVKLLRDDLIDDSESIERFMNEASAAGTLGHPNIVESTDMGFTRNGLPFIVFEYLEGALLTEEIYRVKGMTVRRACQIALQIASALQAAHEAGIIHRDLKTDNIFLCARDGHADHVKVLDFGVSRFHESESDSSWGRKIVGTPEFLAPEQILHPDKVDRRVDVYALGLVLYEMLTARRAFENRGDTDDLLHRIIHQAPPPIGVNDAPPALQELLLQGMLAKDPEHRPATMLEVQKLIAEIAGQARPSGSIPPLRRTPFPGEIRPPLSRTPLPSKTITNLVPPPARTLDNVPPVTRSVNNLRPSDPAIAPPRSSDPQIEPPPVDEASGPPSVPVPGLEPDLGDPSVEAPRSVASLPVAGQTIDLPHEARPRSRIGLPILLVSLLASAAGVASLFVGQETITGTSNVQGLKLHADKLANTFEQAVSALRLRAESIASSPMLRAAVETDAATLRDMIRDRDFVFSPQQGETLEIFARKAGTTSSLLRIPQQAQPLAAVDRADVKLRDGNIVVHAGVAVGGSGLLVLAVPVNLAAVRDDLATSVSAATLEGFDKPYPLKTPGANGPTEEHRFPLTIHKDAQLKGTLVLTVPVPPSETVDRYASVRIPAFGIGGVSLLLGLILLRQRRR